MGFLGCLLDCYCWLLSFGRGVCGGLIAVTVCFWCLGVFDLMIGFGVGLVDDVDSRCWLRVDYCAWICLLC